MQKIAPANIRSAGRCIVALTLALTLKTSSALAALPAGWGDTDIGSPAMAGSASYTNGVWTVAGGGTDIWNTGDQFNFLTNSLNGDGAIIARVISQTAADPWAQAGIMIRGGTTSNAPQVSLMLTPGNGVSFRYRPTTGGSTYQVNQTGVTTPQWLRLSRSGNAAPLSASILCCSSAADFRIFAVSFFGT